MCKGLGFTGFRVILVFVNEGVRIIAQYLTCFGRLENHAGMLRILRKHFET